MSIFYSDQHKYLAKKGKSYLPSTCYKVKAKKFYFFNLPGGKKSIPLLHNNCITIQWEYETFPRAVCKNDEPYIPLTGKVWQSPFFVHCATTVSRVREGNH